MKTCLFGVHATKDFSCYACDLRLMETNLNCARRTHKLKISTMHEINRFKISQACSSLDNVHVGDVVVALSATLTTGSL